MTAIEEVLNERAMLKALKQLRPKNAQEVEAMAYGYTRALSPSWKKEGMKLFAKKYNPKMPREAILQGMTYVYEQLFEKLSISSEEQEQIHKLFKNGLAVSEGILVVLAQRGHWVKGKEKETMQAMAKAKAKGLIRTVQN